MGKWRDSKPSQMDSQRALLGEKGVDEVPPKAAAMYLSSRLSPNSVSAQIVRGFTGSRAVFPLQFSETREKN